ncbi:MAG: LamG domain-containing protein, partial [Candidatus Pacebacteria bacterium]|nr:LamG domain-containing protein [Candidatus Paceibacterota bacterium]
QFESDKYKMGGSNDKTSTDGGIYPELYETGTNLTLIPVNYGDTSLVGYWKFDEGTGTSAYDASGNGYTGTLTNHATYTAGKVGGYAVTLDGTDDYVDLGDIDYSSYTGLTVSFWIYINSAKTGVDEALISNDNWNTDIGFHIRKYTNDNSYFYHASSGFLKALGFSQWKHIVFVINKGSNMMGYSDGTLMASPTSISSYNLDTGHHTLVGANASSIGMYFQGYFDDVRIYNRALSAGEILALYNATK